MFFTPELLERRESGFGLLWLAATLGAKSSFKKLPKRSVLTADISHLCGLIAQPPEPLALRLSSNLMMGVARVYKVKQEIFYTDVTTCYNTLKKAVSDLHTASLGVAELHAGQASLRPDVLTLAVDPGAAFAIDFGNLFGDWEESRQVTNSGAHSDGEESDDEYDPTAKKAKGKQKAREKPPSFLSENIRANLHTLEEHHEHLLSQSFDASFSGTGFVGAPMSASQMEAGFAFSDDVFGLQDGMDLGVGDIGDELARELGEGWGVPAGRVGEDPFALDQHDAGLGMDFQFEAGLGAGLNTDTTPSVRPRPQEREGGMQPDGSIIVPLMPLTPTQGEDVEMHPNPDDPLQAGVPDKPARKAKRVRLLLDARTELTDEELKAARANYMEGQETIRQGLIHKRFEKDSGRIVEELLWGVPSGLQAPVLVDFWMENFKLQVEARSVSMQEGSGQPPQKRRRIAYEEFQEGNALDDGLGALQPADGGLGMDADMDFMMGNNEQVALGGEYDSRMRSSEEPGVARRVSRAPSLIGSQFEAPGVGRDFVSGSQRSALFPWDNAGASSSVAGGPLSFGGDNSARRSLGRADTRLRGSSLGSRRESPLPGGRVPESPADFGGKSALSGEGFEFDVPEESVANESQLSDTNVLTLERNSYNFLEYAKMQLKTFPAATSTLTFDDVVPKQTSTPHVAAAGFYHCLVLATKDLVHVAQEAPYGTLSITVK